ncbi:MAG: HAD hydrolase-like protein [Spirochaetaceae bacterium]|nr:HAD hydrolase-like protein [Spirochaetaceae bacterium]
MIKHILFDVDQTLYPASSLVEKEMVKRMNSFVSEYLGISIEEAMFLRANRDKKYNSTLEWLREAKKLDEPKSFFSAVHPVDFENYFPKNPALISLLSRTTVPCSIFTNSWQKHAENILEYLEISEFFLNIFDIVFNNYLGKHHVRAFTNVLNFLGLKPENVLYIDDNKQFTDIFYSLGGNSVLVDESDEYGKIKYEKICYIEEIEPILEKYEAIKL